MDSSFVGFEDALIIDFDYVFRLLFSIPFLNQGRPERSCFFVRSRVKLEVAKVAPSEA